MYDVIVIGAGPAGSSAAKELASNGYRVLLVEKMRIPREKSCSGVLIKKSIDLVHKYFGEEIPRSVLCTPADIKGMVFTNEKGQEYRFEQEGVNIRRSSFDHWLVTKAEKAGAEVRQATAALSCEEKEDCVIVKLKGDRMYYETAKIVIACDGAVSTIKRKLLGTPKDFITTYQTFCRGTIDLDYHYFYAYLQPQLSEYDAWFNVKDGYLIFGVAVKDTNTIKHYYSEFRSYMSSQHNARIDAQVKTEQWVMPNIMPGCPIDFGRDRVLFAGETAGFLNPMGEGISCGLESGYAAAQAVDKAYVKGQEVNTHKLLSSYQANTAAVKNYMERQWRFVANIASAFAHMKYLLIIALMASTIFSGCTKETSQTNIDISNINENIDEYVSAFNQASSSQRINGSILIARQGDIIASKSYGMADHEKEIPFTQDTVSRLASTSKLFTAIAVMQLHEKGLLNLNDKVSKHIPQQHRGDEITIHNLLNHTAGIIRDVSDFGALNPYEYTSQAKLISLVNKREILFEPGAEMRYSNAGYQLLACIVEKVSGKTYEEYIEENIFIPALMNKTGCDIPDTEIQGLAAGYEYRHGKFNRKRQFDMSHAFGSGHIYSTAYDMYLFDKALREGKLISKKTLNRMISDNTGLQMNYGYGCFVGEINGHKWFGHPGNLSSGYFSYYVCFPDDDLTIIMQFNTVWLDNDSIMKAISAIALGEKYRLPSEKKEAEVDESILANYEGQYRMPDGSIVTVKRRMSGLAVTSRETDFILVPCSETMFFHKGYEHWDHIFECDAQGKVKYYIVRNSVDEIRMKRID